MSTTAVLFSCLLAILVSTVALGDSNCTDWDIRLWSAYNNTPENEGMLQICKNDTWYAVQLCHYHYHFHDDHMFCAIAKLACTQLGYAGAVDLRYNAEQYYGYYYYHDMYEYYCEFHNVYTNLSQCYKEYAPYCDAIGVECYQPTELEPLPSVCNDGDIQLVNGTNDEGRVEYCYNGTWVPVCLIGIRTATLMCQQLEQSELAFSTIYSDERFGRSNINSNFSHIYCHTNFSQCSVRTKHSDCYISNRPCDAEYSLRCYSSENECNDGDVRLVDGAIEQEGRPEVCFNGIWGSICIHSWTTVDSYVLCKTLGYDGPNPITYPYYTFPFGLGDVPVVWSYVHCQGWEQDINDCPKTLYLDFECHPTLIVGGVICKESPCVADECCGSNIDFSCVGNPPVCFCDQECYTFGDCCSDIAQICPLCYEGDVHLVSRVFDDSLVTGVLEVCIHANWTSVCTDSVNFEDPRVQAQAEFACDGLGYTGGELLPPSEYFTSSSSQVITNLSCSQEFTSFVESCLFNFTKDAVCLNHTMDLIVQCVTAIPICYPGQVRLANSVNQTYDDDSEYMSGYPVICAGNEFVPLCNNTKLSQREIVYICTNSSNFTYGFIGVPDYYSLPPFSEYNTSNIAVNFTCNDQFECRSNTLRSNDSCDSYGDYATVTCAKVLPDIIPSIGTASVARNGTVTISFDITALPPVDPSDVQWYFQSSAENLTIPNNNTKKYMFSADQHSLTILNVQLSDVGIYRIEAENIAGSNRAEIVLFVYVEVALQSTTGYTIKGMTGQNVSFNCTADGINRPVITWRKDGQLILSTARLNIDSVNDMQGFRSIPGVQQITSSLTISDLRESDNGSYSCRADNEAEIPVSLDSPFLLNVSGLPIPNPCLSSPCQNGNCQPLGKDYYCMCDEDYTGKNCDIEIPAGTFKSPTIEVHPEDTMGELYESTSLTCTASGNPTPNILWYKDNDLIPNTNSDPSVLLFDELNLDNRGFYYCVAESIINGIKESDKSMEVILNINGVVQYEAVIDLPQDFCETERRNHQNQDQIANLISQINDYLSGGILTSNVSFFFVDILNPEIINFSCPLQKIPILITLITNKGGSEELLEDVEEKMETLGMQLNINITINEVDRFDGCRSNVTDIPSHSGNPNLTISIRWPETNIGELAEVDCPCGNVTLQERSLIATRYCGGDFSNGSQWENPNVAPCNFSVLAREICQLAELETEARVQMLDEFTENSDNLGSTEVIVSVAVLLTATDEVSGNLSLTNDFLNVVDNILNVDVETLQESQESSNTSAMILEAIESVAEEIPVGNTSQPVVITRSAFAVSVQQVDLEQFMEIGQIFSANLGTFSDLNVTENIDSNDLLFHMGPNQSTASISLPNNLFSAILDVTNNTRITHAVFLSDSLFLRRVNNDLEVGGIIISASIVGSNSVEDIDPPLNITFLKNPSINGSDPQCSFWNPRLDNGYGDWSSEGCEIDESYNDSQDVVTCFCNHLTSFCILLDVSPKIEPTEDTPSALVLEAVTYIGLIISICCLLITILSYLSSIKLRTSEHGQLLINLCFALIGLYITFVVAVHSRTVTGLCALSAAVLQYFFLVTFLVMAAEAINLYMKLVIVLGANIPHFVLKAAIISWLTPIFIVLFCFAPNYKNYVSDHFCRAFNIPYYIGMVVPFLIIYIFNWTIFFIIIFTLSRKSCKSDLKNVKKKQENVSFVRQQLVSVTTLSVLFGLGWGIGLFATQDIHNNKIVRDAFAALFVIVTAFHGLFIFIMHCLRSRDIRSVWKQWFYGATGKNVSDFSSSTFDRIRNYRRNTSHTDSTTDGDTLKQYSGKRTSSDSSFFTFNDSNLKRGSDALKYSVGKSLFSQEDAIILGKDEHENEEEMSNEEEARIVESSFNETTVTLDCDDDKEKQQIGKEMTNKMSEI